MNDADKITGEYAVICLEHGKQMLTNGEYDRQMSKPDSLWTCPICRNVAKWDDENEEAFKARWFEENGPQD